MNDKLQQWRESGKYLPPELQDFHAQKDLFKNIHTFVAVDKHEYCKDINWAVGQCYMIDIALWYLARKGYTLQKSRQKLEFEKIEDDTAARQEMENKQLVQMLDINKSVKIEQ